MFSASYNKSMNHTSSLWSDSCNNYTDKLRHIRKNQWKQLKKYNNRRQSLSEFRQNSLKRINNWKLQNINSATQGNGY